ncbi:hypothetical protein HED60_16050 [Planctomycetales bacterium ZRK34]|nr:hypothetical protein HED60_16050 [Planctomycetales bacterium ZRK34]
MSQVIERYLDRVMLYANRKSEHEATAIRDEQRDHLMSRVEECEAEGLAREEAIFRAIELHGHPRTVGYRLRPRFPWVDVRSHGTARGVIAIGPRAVGVFAFGGAAFGVFAIGGFAAGLFGIGGFVATLLFAWGGFGIVPAGVAYVGMGAGLIAVGGMVAGVVAHGGLAAGVWAEGGREFSLYAADTAPGWARAITDMARDFDMLGGMTLCMIALFIPTLLLTLWMQHREQRRLAASDPWLLE